MEQPRYIAIEGVIGAGKTALSKKLAEKLSAKLVLEELENNPFLENFMMTENVTHFKRKCFS